MHGEWQVGISCLIRPDRSVSLAAHAAACCTETTWTWNPTLSLPLTHTLTHSTLDHWLLFSPLNPSQLLLLLLLLPFISRVFPHPRSPSHPAHCVVALLWCFPSGTLLTYIHTHIHIHRADLPACLLTSSRLCCLPASASRRFYSIDTS